VIFPFFMQLLEKYFPLLTKVQKEQFRMLQPLYEEWNAKINVISRRDLENLYLHHVLHSLSIAKIIAFNPGTVVLDAGTGGGFPGIPLAIFSPHVKFILADSIAKKIKVVDAVIRTLGLANCETRAERVEKLSIPVDFVAVRAVTDINTLLKWTAGNIKQGGTHGLKNGLLALKGGELDNEPKDIGSAATIFNLREYFTEPFFETKKLVHVSV
jgi:16S rRNA (guanine527-N7)-methyltransferase